MTTPDLPRPLTTDHKLLAIIATRLDAQTELLGRILDRLPTPPVTDEAGGDAVELREPAAPEQDPAPAPARRTRKPRKENP